MWHERERKHINPSELELVEGRYRTEKKIKGLSYERFHGWAKPRCVLPNGAVQEELSGCILWMLRGKLNDLVQNFMTTNVGSALLSYFFERCEYIYNIEICFFFT